MTHHISERLTQLRKQSGLSQEQLAERLYISRQAVGKWERAEGLPDIENLLLLSRLYGVTMDSLLDLDCADDTMEAEQAAEKKSGKKKTAIKGYLKISIAAVLGITVGFFAFQMGGQPRKNVEDAPIIAQLDGGTVVVGDDETVCNFVIVYDDNGYCTIKIKSADNQQGG